MWIEALIGLFALFILWQNCKKPSSYPPGPWGVPLIGKIPFGSQNLLKEVDKLRSKHGDIISWRIGSKLVVLLCGYKEIKEAFQGYQFVDRPDLSVLSVIEGKEKLGVLGTNGIHWQSLRRFSLHHLKDLGMGKSRMLYIIQHEAKELVNEMKKFVGGPTPIPYALTISVLNVIWQLVASKRYDLNDKEIQGFDEAISQTQENFSFLSLSDFFPILRYVIPEFIFNKISKRDQHLELTKKLIDLFNVFIEDHEKNLDENNPRDYIDAYLTEMKQRKSDFGNTMSYKDLHHVLGDLFVGGSETTKTTLQWGIMFLASFPEVQEKVFNEIEKVLPDKAPPTLEDKPRLPYTDAFIHEVLRLSSLVVTGLPHSNSEDTKLGEYLIPKNSVVVSVASFIHRDPRYFESPKEFRPERFLDSSGKLAIPKEGFFPFGIGKRQCLGEQLARMELYIFLIILIQHLKFSTPPGRTLDLEPEENPLLGVPKKGQDILISIR